MISIIAPVYNLERFLRQGLDSILNQTFLDWELIIVDDGSTDDSPAICDEYESRDDRIQVIHQSNKGVVAARGAGIRRAKGDYFLHFDSDDILNPDALEKIQAAIDETGCDMIIFPSRTIEDPDTIIRLKGIEGGRIYEGKELVIPILDYPALWNNAIRASVAKSVERDFDENVFLQEEYLRIIPTVCRIHDAYVMEECLHNYRLGSGGLHDRSTWKEIQDTNYLTGYVLDELNEHSLLDNETEKVIFYNYLRLVHRIFRKLLGERNITRDQVRELRNHPVFKRSLPYAKRSIIGFKKAAWINLIRMGFVRGIG